jgi:hypothetical protein
VEDGQGLGCACLGSFLSISASGFCKSAGRKSGRVEEKKINCSRRNMIKLTFKNLTNQLDRSNTCDDTLSRKSLEIYSMKIKLLALLSALLLGASTVNSQVLCGREEFCLYATNHDNGTTEFTLQTYKPNLGWIGFGLGMH